ncbi:MAG TPA: DUF924 family protein [Alphaproteobacteria bacterium]|nr:DUF924 family protein [Alphaproteobacteria bacterium]
MPLTPEDILNFWFYEIGRERWFADDRALDGQIRDKFLPPYENAIAGGLTEWEATPEGALALLLLLDQFPRRMFRGTARAFESDERALDLARAAIIKHFDDRIDRSFKLFFYLPFLNSESMGDQRLALFYIRERVKENDWLARAEQHFDIIQRFGRFPQRNPILGRALTAEETEFLKQASAGNA